MIVAGSVLALLLMGLAVDGFVNPADEDPDDVSDENGLGEDLSDQSGEGDGLEELLLAAEEETEGSAGVEPLGFTPLSEIEPDAEEDPAAQVENLADSVWLQSEAAAATASFVEVQTVVEEESGEEIAYIDSFDSDTDSLVLEFDGSAEEAPEIEVEYDIEEDAAFVLANGLPVAMVEGAEEMTPEHVRVVMGGDETALAPQVSPPAETDEVLTPQTLPTSIEDETPLDERPGITDTGTLTPQTLPSSPEDETPLDERPEITGTDVPVPQIQVVNPVLETLELDDDGIPGIETLNTLLDQVSGDMTAAGGTQEMLNARTDMDDAFGTGGEDAQTGTFNADQIEGGDGQDALFGDEGNDTLQAGAGNDELHGDTGDDVLQGEAGIDFLDGGEGNDTLDGGGDRDLLFGGDGDDVLYGGAANDFLQGGMGADMLNGGSGDDTLDGAFGDGNTDHDDADILWGGSGDDILILGQGDMAQGGDGADTFVSGSYVEDAEVAGHVADFNPSEDRIEIIFDPQVSPTPTLEIQDFDDGSGADIILNGEVILSVAGAQGLDPNMIALRAIA